LQKYNFLDKKKHRVYFFTFFNQVSYLCS
jgi:hypothetical protein